MTDIDVEVEDLLSHFGISFDSVDIDPDVEEFLAHFGVLGMHWGIRNEARIGNATTWAKNPALSKSNMSINDIHSKVVKHVNPGYGEKGTKLNCRRCTFSYELRRRGYDVKANRGPHPENLGGFVKATTPGKRFATGYTMIKHVNKYGNLWGKQIVLRKEHEQNLDDGIFRTLASHPDRSRGELAFGWRMGGGHSMAWENVNKKPVIFDNQSGKVYKNVNEFKKFSKGQVYQAGVTRLDNIPLNDKFLSRKWVTNV